MSCRDVCKFSSQANSTAKIECQCDRDGRDFIIRPRVIFAKLRLFFFATILIVIKRLQLLFMASSVNSVTEILLGSLYILSHVFYRYHVSLWDVRTRMRRYKISKVP